MQFVDGFGRVGMYFVFGVMVGLVWSLQRLLDESYYICIIYESVGGKVGENVYY